MRNIPLHPFFDEDKKSGEERPVVKPNETPEATPEKEVRKFHIGEEIKMKSANGKIVGGWKIGEINEKEGYATLMPKNLEDITEAPMTQRVPLEELAEINPERPDFASAASFEELYAEIDRIGGLQGSVKFYSAEELKKRIEQARKIPPAVESVTGTDGLRDRVIALIQEEITYGQKEITKTKEPESEE